jgi:plastocyanin
MRFNGFALVAVAMFATACGGGGEQAQTETPAPAPEAAPAAAPAAPAGAATAAPITGTTHEVKMVGDEKGYRFEPATINAKTGDGIKFVMVSGGPHNVAFDAATLAEDVKSQLQANMPNSTDFSSPMMMTANEAWTVSLGNIKPGTYGIICTPHLAMGMKMELIVQ